ncbi:MAG: MarR family transcriptional regulator [Sciscionella sp.]
MMRRVRTSRGGDDSRVSDSAGDQGMAHQVAAEVNWLLGHLRMMVATAPTSWACQNLTLPQLAALHFIHVDSSLTLTGLTSVLGTGPPATSAMVDRLADAGMVHRTVCPTRRVNSLW